MNFEDIRMLLREYLWRDLGCEGKDICFLRCGSVSTNIRLLVEVCIGFVLGFAGVEVLS